MTTIYICNSAGEEVDAFSYEPTKHIYDCVNDFFPDIRGQVKRGINDSSLFTRIYQKKQREMLDDIQQFDSSVNAKWYYIPASNNLQMAYELAGYSIAEMEQIVYQALAYLYQSYQIIYPAPYLMTYLGKRTPWECYLTLHKPARKASVSMSALYDALKEDRGLEGCIKLANNYQHAFCLKGCQSVDTCVIHVYQHGALTTYYLPLDGRILNNDYDCTRVIHQFKKLFYDHVYVSGDKNSIFIDILNMAKNNYLEQYRKKIQRTKTYLSTDTYFFFELHDTKAGAQYPVGYGIVGTKTEICDQLSSILKDTYAVSHPLLYANELYYI